MNLFELKNNVVVFSPEALQLEPFKVLWDRDTSKNKSKATAELALTYFFCDYKSDFASILDEKDRFNTIFPIIPDLGKNYIPDQEVVNAIEFYRKLQETPALKLINSAKQGLAKLEKFLNTIDLSATDKSGKPKYSPKQLADTIAMLPKLLSGLSILEEQTKKEIEQKNNKLRGGKDKGAFAD